jgi:hypothetical protein
LESPFFPCRSELTSRMHEVLVMRAGPPVARSWDTTTVLGVKGALRRAKPRRALDPLRAVVGVWVSATGGSGGITRKGEGLSA